MNTYLSAAILLLALNCTAATIEGRVVGVLDGDTITLLDQHHKQFRIRLSGIDAPEKKQPFGQRSKESLSSLVFGKPVSVETSKQDLYGRCLGKVLVNGQDANLEQLNRGMAWHYKAYSRSQSLIDRDGYADAENSARAARRGLWAESAPVPPWEYRHSVLKSRN